MVRDIRENPTPTEGVAARYENKETALWKSRETGRANCSPRDAEQAKDPPPQTQPRQSQSRPTQNPDEAEGGDQRQDPGGGQGKDGEEAGHAEAEGKSFIRPGRKRANGVAGSRRP